VTSGSTLTVNSGGTITNATVQSSGTATVAGTDSGSTILAGGNEIVLGTATGDQIYGTQLVSAATAVVSNETVFNGGMVNLYLKGAVANNLTVSSGGTFNISGNATANNTVLTGGGTLNLQSPKATLSGSLTFVGVDTLLVTGVISSGFGDLAVISGFTAGDSVDTTTIANGATLTSAVVSGNTVETVSGGGVSESFIFAGTYTSGFFKLTPDETTGVMITATGTPCYCPGTLIQTETGEVPIEQLAIGDRVTTAGGQHRAIRWIGRRAYSGRFAAGQKQILPIRIAAGALADGLPRRDLMVSPLHAMFLDGVLIPASALVNGVSVVQLERVDSVEYVHLELDSHDVILAEGAPSETFIDDHSRGMFHNAPEYRQLYPDAAIVPAQYCAPRVEDGALLEAVRARLAQRVQPASVLGDSIQGHIDEASRGRIRGWARDVAAPGERVRLRLLADDVVLCEVTADQYRPDLETAGIGDGRYAFDVVIPGGLPQQANPIIRAVRLADGAHLPERLCA
jgi:autotransporter passenger strand-loop-strand repeat protein